MSKTSKASERRHEEAEDYVGPNERQVALFMLKRAESHLEEDLRWVEENFYDLIKSVDVRTFTRLEFGGKSGDRALFTGKPPGFIHRELTLELLKRQHERFPEGDIICGVNYLCALIQELAMVEDFAMTHCKELPKLFRAVHRSRTEMIRDAINAHLCFFYADCVKKDEMPANPLFGYFAYVSPYKPVFSCAGFSAEGNLKSATMPPGRLEELMFSLEDPISTAIH